MKIRNYLQRSFIALASLSMVVSCTEEDKLTVQDSSDITEEALTDAYFQDLGDMAGVAIEAPNENEYSGGRSASSYTITIQDERFKCDGVVVTLTPDPSSTLIFPKGSITVDFGSEGCSDLRGNVRKGKAIFTYNGWRFMPGSTVVVTTEDYHINGVKLEGTYTLTNVQTSTSNAPHFRGQLENGKATFEDGSVAERKSDVTWEWVRAANPVNDQLIIDKRSNSSGKTRAGRTYEVTLSKSLKYKRACGLPIEGTKHFLFDGEKEITIDYGNGECDRIITITVGGVSTELELD